MRFKLYSNNTNGIDPKTRKFKTGVMQNKNGEKYTVKLHRKMVLNFHSNNEFTAIKNEKRMIRCQV